MTVIAWEGCLQIGRTRRCRTALKTFFGNFVHLK